MILCVYSLRDGDNFPSTSYYNERELAMAVGEQERFELLNGLIEALGEDVAHKLMDSLPPVSWDQVATKDDLNTLATAITAKFDQVDAQFKSVNAQFESVNAKFEMVAAEFVSLRGEIAKEIAGISKKITDQTRIMVTMIGGFSLAVCAAMAGGILFA